MGNPFEALAKFGITEITAKGGANDTLTYILHGDGTGKDISERVAVVRAMIKKWTGKRVRVNAMSPEEFRTWCKDNRCVEPNPDSNEYMMKEYSARGVVLQVYCCKRMPRRSDGTPVPIAFRASLRWENGYRGTTRYVKDLVAVD